MRHSLRKLPALTSAFSVLIAATITAKATAAAVTYNDEKVDTQIKNLVKQMTVDEKILLLSGTADEMGVPGIERLGIPQLKFSDGPVGVRVWGKSTAYPAGAMLAATWNTDTARAVGKALGRDCRARGVHILLGPGCDLYRVAQCGRNFEYFGEDPFLSAAITSAWIKGCQGERVAACVKHYAANDQEIQRGSINTIIDERRLHEICLPPFKAAVQDANSWTLMAAYNKVNGDWCTANKYLLDDVLRKHWGFKGTVISDWGAVHDALGPLTAGTDLEMGTREFYKYDTIKGFLRDGKLSEAVLDERVSNVLRPSVAMGWFDNKQEDKSIPLDDPTSDAVALQVAREGLVLLKNQNNFLPLDKTKIRKLVVLGPNVWPPVISGGGSSYTQPFKSVGLQFALKDIAGPNTEVVYVPTWVGPDPTKALNLAINKIPFEPLPENGLSAAKVEYFANNSLAGPPVLTDYETIIDHQWAEWQPKPLPLKKPFSARWTFKIKAPQTDEYDLAFASDNARIAVEGQPYFNLGYSPNAKRLIQSLSMKAGESRTVVIEYKHDSTEQAVMQFAFNKSSKDFSPEQKNAIEEADVVVAAVGFNAALESEGFDRSLDLPAEQQELLKTVSQLNPRTIAVINAGGNVLMQGSADKVPALLHAWYPGQHGYTAVAEAIFGELNPSGRLPDTFERKWEDSPAFSNYPGDSADGGTVKYAEGIYVGYRHYDKKNIEPLYPFGYGLSYTTFAMKNAKLTHEKGQPMTASVDVTNTGARPGAEVVQMYVRPIGSTVDRPKQELKGFARVVLAAGETKTVTLPLNAESFAIYDAQAHQWVSPAGKYEIAFGASSRDIHCSQTLDWHGD